MNSETGRDLANLANRRLGRAVRINPDVIGRHHAAGGIFVVLDSSRSSPAV